MIRVRRQPGTGVRYAPDTSAPLETSDGRGAETVGVGENVGVRDGESVGVPEGERDCVCVTDAVTVGVRLGVIDCVAVIVALGVSEGEFDGDAPADSVADGVAVAVDEHDPGAVEFSARHPHAQTVGATTAVPHHEPTGHATGAAAPVAQ